MYTVKYKSQFKKDLKRLKKQSVNDFNLLKEFVENLAETGYKGISEKHLPHKLKGKYSDFWECHVKPDLLLIWEETKDEVRLQRAGSHSDLF